MNIRIGHPAYMGRNSATYHKSYQSALNNLLSRGVKMAAAHKKLKRAKGGGLTVISDRFGYNVIEIVYISH